MLPVKRTNPLADRNCKPIADALRLQLVRDTPNLQLLEIASGIGQYAGFLAPLFPNIVFHPTDDDPVNLSSLKAYAEDCVTDNIIEPVIINVENEPRTWPKQYDHAFFDYILNINMIQISRIDAATGLFRAAGLLLKPKGKLFTFGPYGEQGDITPKSNKMFDDSLRIRNPDWGIRDIGELQKMAKPYGLQLTYNLNMPGNNKLLTWTKKC